MVVDHAPKGARLIADDTQSLPSGLFACPVAR
jgi:hypothetical protein